MEHKLKEGGLFRCCVETWCKLAERNGLDELDEIECPHCGAKMEKEDFTNVWSWKRDT